MLNIKNADVVGTREFTSKNNKQYKIIYFLLENEYGVKGMATGQCFVSTNIEVDINKPIQVVWTGKNYNYVV